jgi:predicted dehydrogenase
MKRESLKVDQNTSTADHKRGTFPAVGVRRRTFLAALGIGLAGPGSIALRSAEPKIQGFEAAPEDGSASTGWKQVSDRKIKVGIAGYGLCKFGAAFSFQDHPNVEIVAVTDLFPDRCEGLAKACRCGKTYPSLEEMVKDDRIEAVFVATDAPGHARHCMEVLKHGKHVASAVPAAFGNLEEAHQLYEAVKQSKLKYMMFETSAFHNDLSEMRELYKRGSFGRLVYSEGEYYHYMEQPLDSYKDWRVGLPPQWYPTHSNAYYVATGAGHFTHVSCMGMPSKVTHLQPANNVYRNPFGTEIANFRTSEGGMSRMAVSWDTPGAGGEMGRVRGQKGSYYQTFQGLEKVQPVLRPPLPPGVAAGGHGGSHGYLCDEFVSAILQDRQPLVDISMALNMTVSGILAHESAMKDGEWLKIPVFRPLA